LGNAYQQADGEFDFLGPIVLIAWLVATLCNWWRRIDCGVAGVEGRLGAWRDAWVQPDRSILIDTAGVSTLRL
jgi:hypothetical protein